MMFRSPQSAPPLPLPLLITGIAGVPGYNALHYFQRRYPGQVIGIRQADNGRIAGPGIVACNAEDREALERLFDQYQFGSVLNCAGCCALKPCELDTRLAWRTNVEGVVTLLSLVVERPVRLVHLSVDLVFTDLAAGRHTGFDEDDPTDPITVYGKTMVSAEQLILDWFPPAALLRISLPMGISPGGHAGAIDWILSRFRAAKPATLFFDEIRAPTYTDCLNEVCEAMLCSPLEGVYHATSSHRLSLYQIGQVINRVGGFDPDLLMGAWRRDAAAVPPRVGNTTLAGTKLAGALGYEPFHPWPADPLLLPTHRQWHYERHESPGSLDWLTEVLYCNPLRTGSQSNPARDQPSSHSPHSKLNKKKAVAASR